MVCLSSLITVSSPYIFLISIPITLYITSLLLVFVRAGCFPPIDNSKFNKRPILKSFLIIIMHNDNRINSNLEILVLTDIRIVMTVVRLHNIHPPLRQFN